MTELPASRVLSAAFDTTGLDENAIKALHKLRASYVEFRERAGELSGEIERDFKHLTVHDGTHLDALWEIVDQVLPAGDRLNPVEAYILGGAILLHDLGLSVAAYPDPAALRVEPRWSDSLTSVFEQRNGRRPTSHELANPAHEVVQGTQELLLRQLHARQAEALATAKWTDDRGEQRFLIEDVDLRRTLGVTIGRLAHSHWWETDVLAEHFDKPLGSPTWAPASWTPDLLRLAALLRVADALHLDARRAPMFVRTLRRPYAESARHWAFQERLAKVIVDGDRAVFTSGDPFGLEDAQAWWLCFETLQDVDRWLREVDALLSDLGRARLAVRAVRGVDDPGRFARLVPVSGWTPADTHVRVSNLASLVEKLGGEQLYGGDHGIAVRELVQNGADAVRARRALLGLDEAFGQVTVRLGVEDEGDWIEVEDNGVGMSAHVLTHGLLDFGTSFWAARDLPAEFPGLLAKGFDAAGQFGVGFFSVFMLGRQVRVTTRPFRLGEAETQVLEFANGVGERPLLRAAEEHERLLDGGTRVRVWLEKSPTWLFGPSKDGTPLLDYCRNTCLALDVTIVIEEEARRVIPASSWKTMSRSDVAGLAAGWNGDGDDEDGFERALPFVDNIREVHDESGSLVARLAIAPDDVVGPRLRVAGLRRRGSGGAVTASGFRGSELTNMMGVALGDPVTAARDVAVPRLTGVLLADWATQQATLIAGMSLSPEDEASAAEVVRACRGETGALRICMVKDGWLDREALVAWFAERSSGLLVQDAALANLLRDQGPFEIGNDVVAAARGIPGVLQTRRDTWVSWPERFDPDTDFRDFTLEGVVVEAAAQAWDVPIEALVDNGYEELSSANGVEIGVRDATPVLLSRVNRLRRPE